MALGRRHDYGHKRHFQMETMFESKSEAYTVASRIQRLAHPLQKREASCAKTFATPALLHGFSPLGERSCRKRLCSRNRHACVFRERSATTGSPEMHATRVPDKTHRLALGHVWSGRICRTMAPLLEAARSTDQVTAQCIRCIATEPAPPRGTGSFFTKEKRPFSVSELIDMSEPSFSFVWILGAA